MKIVKLFIVMMAAVSGLMIQGCSSVADDVISSSREDVVLLSRSDAQSQIDELVANNTYLDYDFTAALGRTSRRGNKVTEDEVITRVIWYRFYKIQTIENNRVVAKGTAADINISQRAFDHCLKVQESTNRFLERRMSEGDSFEEAWRDCSGSNPQNIERVIKLR